ncbi:MAG: hypothetical protein D6820_15425 [Lentisphaerae bacterium]|nr:MAG: hypothetical protein D6820_15425 [Lentisphaerota bacterium]
MTGRVLGAVEAIQRYRAEFSCLAKWGCYPGLSLSDAHEPYAMTLLQSQLILKEERLGRRLCPNTR